jgi:hypothetical protein
MVGLVPRILAPVAYEVRPRGRAREQREVALLGAARVRPELREAGVGRGAAEERRGPLAGAAASCAATR